MVSFLSTCQYLPIYRIMLYHRLKVLNTKSDRWGVKVQILETLVWSGVPGENGNTFIYAGLDVTTKL